MSGLLTTREILSQLSGWSVVEGRNAIFKSFKFKSFAQAMTFMNQVAKTADEIDHHPEWFNVYNRVDVTLTTHSAGGVTALDVALAKAMDEITKS
jgi:4a-hydroxytetrahydrobiopterin dehydratase